MRRDVFQAIADPTRREIIHILAGGPLNLNSVAARFTVSRPAISRHIKILSECGLIVVKQQGRERNCHPNLKSLSEVSCWVDTYRTFWTKNLDALERYLQNSAAGEKKRSPSAHRRKPKDIRLKRKPR
jgi:DNA-binding transcriptional ArsR family regulator